MRLPPAGHWDDKRRPVFVADPRPEPDPAAAAELVLRRYLAAFGPASRRDVAAWSGVAQRDFAGAFERVETVSYRDEHDRELGDPTVTVDGRVAASWSMTRAPRPSASPASPTRAPT